MRQCRFRRRHSPGANLVHLGRFGRAGVRGMGSRGPDPGARQKSSGPWLKPGAAPVLRGTPELVGGPREGPPACATPATGAPACSASSLTCSSLRALAAGGLRQPIRWAMPPPEHYSLRPAPEPRTGGERASSAQQHPGPPAPASRLPCHAGPDPPGCFWLPGRPCWMGSLGRVARHLGHGQAWHALGCRGTHASLHTRSRLRGRPATPSPTAPQRRRPSAHLSTSMEHR